MHSGVIQIDGGVNRNAGGIIASVLQTAEAVEKHFQNVAPVSADIEIQVCKNPTHNSSLLNLVDNFPAVWFLAPPVE